MSMTDPLADMLTRIRNACKARKTAVDVPASNLKRQVARIMIEENFLKDMLEIPDGKQGILRIYLKYSKDDEPIIRGLRRLSVPGRKYYINLEELQNITRSRIGVTIVSTSRGVMSNARALESKIGGEALCNIW